MTRAYTNEVALFLSLDELNRAIQVQRRRLDVIAPARIFKETAAGKTISLAPVDVTTPRPAPVATKREVSDLDRLDALNAQTVLVANIAAQIRTNFVGVRLAYNAAKACEALLADVVKRRDELRRKLTIAARDSKRISRGLLQANHSVASLIATDFKGRHGPITEGYLLSPVTPPRSSEEVDAEIGYTRVPEFRSDDGHTHPELWIVTARPAKQGGDKFWVATVPFFRVPKKIRWERTAKSGPELRAVVLDLLAEDGVVGKTFPRPVPLQPDQLTLVHDNVRSARIEGGAIVVQVKNRKLLDQTKVALRSQITGLVKLADPKNRDMVRESVQRDKGTIKFVFTLPKSMRGRLVSPEKLAQIGNLLSLKPEDLQRVRTAIENPED